MRHLAMASIVVYHTTIIPITLNKVIYCIEYRAADNNLQLYSIILLSYYGVVQANFK